MSMNGDYLSLAEACGETTHHTGWVAGEDFDPSDPEEMEAMHLVWDRERHETIARLEAENARLRSLLYGEEGDE
jgi:hypothetical protein